MSDLADAGATRSPAVWFWGAAFFVGMFGAPLLGRILHASETVIMATMLLAMLLLIPFMRAMERNGAASGSASAAARAYNRRMMIASFGYVAALFVAVSATQALRPEGPLAWALAVLPSVGVIGMVWAMARYLVDEGDEYLRARAVQAALVATGMLLTVATVWGFLESFRLVPHVPGWAAVPLWAVGLGLGRLPWGARA